MVTWRLPTSFLACKELANLHSAKNQKGMLSSVSHALRTRGHHLIAQFGRGWPTLKEEKIMSFLHFFLDCTRYFNIRPLLVPTFPIAHAIFRVSNVLLLCAAGSGSQFPGIRRAVFNFPTHSKPVFVTTDPVHNDEWYLILEARYTV